MVGATPQGALLEVQQRTNQRIMKRSNSSAEDMMRGMIRPHLERASIEASIEASSGTPWRIADRRVL